MIELLDGLCARVGDYALWTPSAAWAQANPEADVERQWVRIKGDDKHEAASAGAHMHSAACARQRGSDATRPVFWELACAEQT